MRKSIHGESKRQNGDSEVPESVKRATNELKLYGEKKCHSAAVLQECGPLGFPEIFSENS